MSEKRMSVKKIAELRFEHEEPIRLEEDSLEYETKEQRERREKNEGSTFPLEDADARIPLTEEEKEKAKKAEAFLKRWGV